MLALKVARNCAIESSLTDPTEGTANRGSDKRAPMATLSVLKMFLKTSGSLVRIDGPECGLEESGSCPPWSWFGDGGPGESATAAAAARAGPKCK